MTTKQKHNLPEQKMKKTKADNKTILQGERGQQTLVPNSQKLPKAEERKMDCELTSVSHGSHDDSHDSHDSHDSLARTLSRP